jgi:hypothetical protein
MNVQQEPTEQREIPMTAIVILNIVLSAFVIIGVLSLLAWGILADRKDRTARATVLARPQARTRVAPRTARPSRSRIGGTVRGNA